MLDRVGHLLASWLVPVNAWTAALLIGILLADRALARGTRPSLRVALYAPIALRVVLPLSWSIPFAAAPRMMAFSAATIEPAAASVTPGSGAVLTRYAALAAAYLAVAAVLAARAIARRARLVRALASARAVTGVDAAWPVVCHPELGPMVVGILAPRIILPGSLLEAGSEPVLARVLRHEVAHLSRRDPWLSGAMELLLVCAWPVASLWLAAARVRALMELACDDAAVAGFDAAERRRYGHTLLDVAERWSSPRWGELHFGSRLRARIEALASPRRWSTAVQVASVAAGVLAFAACSTVAPRPGEHASEPNGPAAEPAWMSRADVVSSTASLPPDVIRDVMHRNFDRFGQCYEDGAAKEPRLRGTVKVAFLIDRGGAVAEASDYGSDMPDRGVVDCVTRIVRGLSFPAPAGGLLTVVYPIEFHPADEETSAAAAARLREGHVLVQGSIPSEEIERVMGANSEPIRSCYREGLERDPTLHGRLQVSFTIDARGAATAVCDEDESFPDEEVVRCVLRSFGDLSFPKPLLGTVRVKYPMLLTLGGD
jgi:beta-lactamase regulating signal transducer with metallopeptidase domain